MATLNAVVVLPERANTFFGTMSGLLPKQIYNVDPEFMIPRLAPVAIHGTVVPLSVVKIFVNGLDQSPVPDIVADADGNWASTILLGPGQNSVQVQFFPPELIQERDETFTPTLTINNVLVHPTLFSRFSMQNDLQMLLLDGNHLFLGNYVPPPVNTKTLARFDMTTGASVVLDATTVPSSGRVYFMEQDTNWLFVSQVMGDTTIKLSRYAKDLSARTDILTYATVPNSLHSDGTNLFAVRTTGSDTRLSKINPTTFLLVGSEISIKNGAVGESVIAHDVPGDDGTNLMTQTSRIIAGDGPGNDIIPGSPDLGANLILENNVFHRKTKKSDMSDLGNFTTIMCTNSPDEDFQGKNSLVRFGGFYYTVASANNGKVVKLQEGTFDGLPALFPVEVTPLPFSTVVSPNYLPTLLKLGPDSRLYVVGDAHLARFVPGSTSIQHIARGEASIDVDASRIAVVDDSAPSRALAADLAIFTDRAQTFTVVAPVAPPSNLRVHYNNTQTRIGLGWNPTGDGSAFVVEQAVNAGSFSEVGREYFGNGFSVKSAHLPVFHSGDTLRYRVSAFNSVGTSAPSAEATWSVPYLTPPLGNCANLLLTSVVGPTVTVHFDDGEITLGGPINATTNRPHVLFLYRSPDGLTGWTQVAARSMIPDNVQPDGTPVGGAFTYNPSTRANQQVTMVDPSATSYPYFYRVRAEQRDGPSLTFPSIVYGPGAYSNTIQVDAPPSTPTGVYWEAGWEGAFVAWTPGVGGGIVTGYTVKRSIDNTVSYPTSFNVGLVTSYHDATAFGNPQVRYDKVFASGPGGNSADSPIQGGALSLAPVYHEVSITNIGSGGAGLVKDGSFAYAISSDSSGVNVVVTKISLADSSIRTQNLTTYVPFGTFALIYSSLYFGGYIYILLKDQGEANGKIIKVDPSNMMTVASLPLTTGGIFPSGFGLLVTDGTDCWAVSGLSGSGKVTHFNPVTMSNISTGASIGSNLLVYSATAFGGKLFLGIRNTNTSANTISRVDTSTLAIVETVSTSVIAFPESMVNDGSVLYVHGSNGGQGRIEKFSTGPLAFVASTADLGLITVTSLVYDSGSNAVYLVHRSGGTSGLMKVSAAPAFVSAIAQFHMNQGTPDGARTDGTYVYFMNSNGYVSRESIASF